MHRVEETLPAEVLAKMYAPGQDKSIPFITPAKLEGSSHVAYTRIHLNESYLMRS